MIPMKTYTSKMNVAVFLTVTMAVNLFAAASNGRVTVKFVATKWLAGGFYDVRLLRPEK